MFGGIVDLWCYWDWFLIRQGVKGAKNRVQRSFALGVIETIIPVIGVCSMWIIFFKTSGLMFSTSTTTGILWVTGGFFVLISFIGSRKRLKKKAEFEAFDKRLIRKYDIYAWVFALASIAAFVSMLIVGDSTPALGRIPH